MQASIRSVNLHWAIHGEGEPVLFVHGFPLSGVMWDATLEQMGGGIQAIVPDLRGLGKSEASDRASMSDYADDLAAILDQSGVTQRVVVVGLSMGGYVAFEFVRKHAERVRALALVDTRANTDDAERRGIREQTAARVLREGSGVVADAMAGQLFAPDAPAAMLDEWRGIMAASSPVGVAAALHAMKDRPDSYPTLARMNVPVMIVVGEHDSITPPDESRRMTDACPAAVLHIVPGAGHMTPVECPSAFADLLRAFIAGL